MVLGVPIMVVALAATTYAIYQLITYIVTNIRASRKAKELGCGKAPKWPSDLFGYSNARDLINSDYEKRFPVRQVERFNELSEKVGFVAHTHQVTMPPFSRFFVTYEPRNLQAMLATQFKDFQIPDSRLANLGVLLKGGIFCANGKQWEFSRGLMRPQFVRDQVSDLTLEEEHVQYMMQAIVPDKTTGWTDLVDMQTLFFRLTLDTATQFLFGESVNSQLSALPGSKVVPRAAALQEINFAYSFDRSQDILSKASRMGDMWWWGHTSELRREVKKCQDFVDYYVDLALKQPVNKSGEKKDGERYVFLEGLVAETRDPLQLRQQLLNILLAGRDTTASLLSWLFRELAIRPEIYKKLREEIIRDFGTYESGQEITFTGLKNCQYLQWCMNEALRVYPLVPVNAREAVRDTTLPTGGGPEGKDPIFLRKGDEVIYSVHVVHHRRDLWGEDADEFKPERWNNRRPGWEYLPFNGGPRICIGQQFALTEAGYVVVRLLQRFEELDGQWIRDEETKHGYVRHGLTLINCPADGTKMRLKAAAAS